MSIDMSMTPALEQLLGDRGRGALVTLKRDGRPQISTVDYCYENSLIRISVTDGRAKTRNLRREPRASFYVRTGDGWSWVVAEGTAELTPVAQAPDDATVEELIDVYRRVGGEHPDWNEYRAAMVADQRLVIRLHVERAYGTA